MKIKLTLLVLFLKAVLSAQNYSGIVSDAETKERVSYVAFGIVGKSAGTISDHEGYYSFTMDPKFDSDSIRISLIGYRSVTFKVSDFKNIHSDGQVQLSLTKAAIQLDEVIVSSEKLKRKRIGHNFNNPNIILGLRTDEVGSEVAAYIPLKNKTALIENVRVNIARNQFDSVLLRINIYSEKDGLPGKLILKKPIYHLLKIKTGPVNINLKEDNISVKEGFFVSVQWISKEPSKLLSFCAGFRGSHAIRNSSEDTWEKVKSIGLGINCEMLY